MSTPATMPAMSYRVTINGIPVSCDSAVEAMALINQAGKTAGKTHLRPQVTNGKSTATDSRVREVLKFLKAIEGNGGRPLGSDALLKAIGCETTNALGGVVSNAHRHVAAIHLPFDDVALRIRRGNLKYWQAGPRIKEAIDKLSEV